jgi:hypothetical protein
LVGVEELMKDTLMDILTSIYCWKALVVVFFAFLPFMQLLHMPFWLVLRVISNEKTVRTKNVP